MNLKNENIVIINSESIRNSDLLNQTVLSYPNQVVIICRSEWTSILDLNHISSELAGADIIHSGLKFEGAKAFQDLLALTFNWNFLTPEIHRDSFTWKATSDFICFNTDIVRKMNGFVCGLSVNAALMEFCYRAMMAGALVKHCANIVGGGVFEPASITRNDNLYFALHHLGKKHYLLLRGYYLLFHFDWRIHLVKEAPPQLDTNFEYRFKIKYTEKIRAVTDYTAIIPTIGRYDYIEKSILSLLDNPYPPNEIIVVDQTPKEERQYAIYQSYIDKGVLKVFYLDSPGQCTSRNLAIEKSKNEWLLFFEDDTEAWNDMMREHIELMEYSRADVSTGISLAPWKDVSYIPSRLKKFHVADVLATGNCFMHKSTALSVGGLHMAFNRGSGADDDFGKRLFLNGKLIVFNYKAIQTHYKAPTGGMRVHGAWWRNSSKLFSAYPPPTQMFMIQKYYASRFWLMHLVLFYIQAKKGNSLLRYLIILLLAPVKIVKSIRAASRLKKSYVQLYD